MRMLLTNEEIEKAFARMGFDVVITDSIQAKGFERYLGIIFNPTSTFGKRMMYVETYLMIMTEKAVCLKAKDGSVMIDVSRECIPIYTFEEAISKASFKGMQLPLILGEQMDGSVMTIDLENAPHILVVGSNGYGKTNLLRCFEKTLTRSGVCLCSINLAEDSIMSNSEPFTSFASSNGSDTTEIILFKLLEWLSEEIMRRYVILSEAGCKHILYLQQSKTIPYLVLIVDGLEKLAERMSSFDKYIKRINAKARAAGIHIIVSQNIDYSIITGTVLNNFPVRICFSVQEKKSCEYCIGDKEATYQLSPGEAMVQMPRKSVDRILTPFLVQK